MEFIERIAESFEVPIDHPVVRYLIRKTKAVDRGSKARRSLGNLYALHVVAEDYLEGRVSRFTDLLARMKNMPFGAKLQNHPLDNRLNDEFSRSMGVPENLLPIKAGLIQGSKSRSISLELLGHKGSDPVSVASFIVEAINTYISMISDKQVGSLAEIEAIDDKESLAAFFESAFDGKADARLFEVASYVLLAAHYNEQTIWIGDDQASASPYKLRLFKTGRTNANDGGIDFVLKPRGRFYQVTETLDFTKYFLDLDKVNRFPITFVIKTELTPANAMEKVRKEAMKSGRYTAAQVGIYLSLFEEVFTLETLRAILSDVKDIGYEALKAELILQFQLEYGLFD